MKNSPMWLVYEDVNGDLHYQPWIDVVEVGTLIDPETGDDMQLVYWTDEEPSQ